MIIKNAKIYTKNFKFEEGELSFSNGWIDDAFEGEVFDAKGMMVIPGLIDLHFHGCHGHDFTDGTHEALKAMTEYEARNGITAVCPASMPISEERLLKSLENAGSYESESGAVFCGVNLEGPFLTQEKRGANDARYLYDPDITLYEAYQKAARNKIRIVSVAPDMDNAIDFIKEISKETVVSLAHTPAGYEKSMEGFRAGASLVTHLFNGMSAFHHRDTGLVGAAMDAGSYVELIGDGIHVSDPMLRAAYKIYGAEKIVLISDSLSCTGLKDGVYDLGEQTITVENGIARAEDGGLAGASSNLYMNLCHMTECGIPLEDVVRMASHNPARVLGVDHQMGSLEKGKMANFVILDEHLKIHAVYIKGKKVCMEAWNRVYGNAE